MGKRTKGGDAVKLFATLFSMLGIGTLWLAFTYSEFILGLVGIVSLLYAIKAHEYE